MVVAQKNDFVELEFVAKIKDTNEVFDTNMKSEIEKIKSNFEPKKYVLAVGHNMTIKGLDKDLEGKEVGKEYESDFKPEDAFGKRNPAMVKMIPLKVFIEQKIMPQKGMQLSLDGTVVKVISVSGGRVLVDFNNPLAGKVLTYKYIITKKLEDQKEKVDALQGFFFRSKFDYEIKGKELIFKVGKDIAKFIEMMAKPFDEILGLTTRVEIAEKKVEKSAN